MKGSRIPPLRPAALAAENRSGELLVMVEPPTTLAPRAGSPSAGWRRPAGAIGRRAAPSGVDLRHRSSAFSLRSTPSASFDAAVLGEAASRRDDGALQVTERRSYGTTAGSGGGVLSAMRRQPPSAGGPDAGSTTRMSATRPDRAAARRCDEHQRQPAPRAQHGGQGLFTDTPGRLPAAPRGTGAVGPHAAPRVKASAACSTSMPRPSRQRAHAARPMDEPVPPARTSCPAPASGAQHARIDGYGVTRRCSLALTTTS